MLRHGLNQWIHQRALASVFPLGIFIINVAGSIAIGVLVGLIVSNRIHISEVWRTFLIVGLLGGFTTFSSFSLDTLTLLRTGHPGLALWNVAGQIGLSLIGVWVGFKAST